MDGCRCRLAVAKNDPSASGADALFTCVMANPIPYPASDHPHRLALVANLTGDANQLCKADTEQELKKKKMRAGSHKEREGKTGT